MGPGERVREHLVRDGRLVRQHVVGLDVVGQHLVGQHMVRIHLEWLNVVRQHLVWCRMERVDLVGEHLVRKHLVGEHLVWKELDRPDLGSRQTYSLAAMSVEPRWSGLNLWPRALTMSTSGY